MTTPHIQSNEEIAKEIFRKIDWDLSDRRGIKNNWGNALDEEIEEEIKNKFLDFFMEALTTKDQQIATAVEKERESKDGAYRERDMLVCALSKLFPAYLAHHSDDDIEWENDWRWIVYIELPTGQVSWHIHDSERDLFNHLEVKENNWDGHNTERKYERLKALAALTPLPTKDSI